MIEISITAYEGMIYASAAVVFASAVLPLGYWLGYRDRSRRAYWDGYKTGRHTKARNPLD